MAFLLDPEKLGAKFFTHDRNTFEWEWHGHRPMGEIYVGDVLFAVTPLEIRDEFIKRLKAEFRVTGGGEEADEF